MRRYRRILHATDFSPTSTGAFRHAVGLAREHRAMLILVHVVSEAMPLTAIPEIGSASVAETYHTLRDSALRRAPRGLDALVAVARRAGVRVRARVIEGTAHERVVQVERGERGAPCLSR
jgi:nucleotide-binding universal stress UspA family protein